MNIQQDLFGMTRDNQKVERYTLTSTTGAQVQIITIGGIITTLTMPDHKGQLADIVLGYETLTQYETDVAHLGTLVGRYGNRIANGLFILNGQTCKLATNNGPNHLHGGIKGFNKKIWKATPFHAPNEAGVRLFYTSFDGEEGYPGTLTTEITYTFTDIHIFKINYRATTDKPTPINLTHHGYFNLSGAGNILDHTLMLKASQFTPVHETLIPTGEIRSVQNTPLDFTKMRRIGDLIDAHDEQIRFGGGYDHNFVIDHWDNTLRHFATVADPQSGRTMDLYTTEPGVQFYTGNFLNGSAMGKNNTPNVKRSGFCLETQHFPDSPNQPHFPSTVLNPGEIYRSETQYVFSAR